MKSSQEKLCPELVGPIMGSPDFELYSMEQLQFARDFVNSVTHMESNDRVAISRRTIPGLEGDPDVPVLVFERADRGEGPLPCVLYIHSGGFMSGGPEDEVCLWILDKMDCVVVSPDYRLAPEHPYPAAFDDSRATFEWVAASAQELGIDKDRIAIAGQSAGATLTASLGLYYRDHGGPRIAYLWMMYPAIDDKSSSQSCHEIDCNKLWTIENSEFMWNIYLGEGHEENDLPYYAVPIRCEDWSGLPPVCLAVGEIDMFRDEVLDLGLRLVRSGVPTELHLWPGLTHAGEKFMAQTEYGSRIIDVYLSALKRGLGA